MNDYWYITILNLINKYKLKLIKKVSNINELKWFLKRIKNMFIISFYFV